MLVRKYVVFNAILTMILCAFSEANAEVLELGESQLHGKKDQPEAMTFVSRAPLDISFPVTGMKTMPKITAAIKDDRIFGLRMPD